MVLCKQVQINGFTVLSHVAMVCGGTPCLRIYTGRVLVSMGVRLVCKIFV